MVSERDEAVNLDMAARRQLQALGFRPECLNCAVALAVARVVAKGKEIVGDVDLADVASGEVVLSTEDNQSVLGEAQELMVDTYQLGARMVGQGLHQLVEMRGCPGFIREVPVEFGTAAPINRCGSTGGYYDGLPEEPKA